MICNFTKLLSEQAATRFEVQVIGDGLSDHAFAEKVKQENGDFVKNGVVKFLGRRSDIKECLQKIDLIVVPSRQDPLPTVIIEAFLSGVPVLGTPVGGIPEMISLGKNGFICSQVKDFVSKAFLLLEDKELWERFSAEARKTAEEKFSATVMQRRLLDLYCKAKAQY